MFDRFLTLFRRRPAPAPRPCQHPHLLIDTYRDVLIATCPICGESWLAEELDWTPVEGGDGEPTSFRPQVPADA